ncbi:MAG TPA: DUF4349 domain-containing protein [Longimicrobium sp.]|nr:DUF4349 domain-containing protein [Longimicrobium sp.]
MPSRSSLAAVLLLLSTPACASFSGAALPAPPPPSAPGVASRPALAPGEGQAAVAERLLIRRAELELTANEPAALAARVTEIAQGAGGFVESSLVSEGRVLRATMRVPAPALESTLASLSALGKVERREISAVDVTEQVIDLEGRLGNLRALRDRLRQHLERAAGVGDLIEVERELTRVQGEIEGIEGRLVRLRTDTSLSQIRLEVHRRRVLGPLGQLVAGLAWLVEKLFVIR